MRGAAPLSIALHAGILGAVLFAGFAPSDGLEAESVAIDIVSLEVAVVSDPDVVPSEAIETLVSAGAESAAPETLVADLAEPVAPVRTPMTTVAAIVAKPVEAETIASAEVLVSAALDTPDLEALLPQQVAATAVEVTEAAAIAPASAPVEPLATPVPAMSPVTPVTPTEPIEIAAIEPVAEIVSEVKLAPVPLPRPPREEAEPPRQVAAPKVVEPRKQQPAEKPAPKPQQQASLGNGGADNADSRASKASGGQGKKASGGSGAATKYPGRVQVKVARATRYPSSARGAHGEAQVTFTVAADGGVSRASLSRSSGNALLDAAALEAVARAAPFPPIPDEAGRSSWTFTVPVAFRK